MKKLLSWLVYHLFTNPHQRDIDTFLGQAVDLADLEWRLKEIRNHPGYRPCNCR